MIAKVEYPKWVYHASGDSKIVADAYAHDKAGAWWFEDPLTAAAALAQAAAEATGLAPVATPSPVAPPPDALTIYYAAKVKQVLAKVVTLETAADVDELAAIEAQRPGGPRKLVVQALAGRRANLAQPV